MKSYIRHLSENVYFRISIAVMLAIAATWLAINQNWLWTGISLAALIGAVLWLGKLYSAQTRKVIYMLDALENNDNVLRFSQETGSESNQLINGQLNRVARILNEVKSEAVQQEKYYELILSCINTGIVVLNDSGAVYQKNNEALRLLGLEIFTHVRQLCKIDSTLMQKLSDSQPGDHLQVQFHNERGTVNLAIRVSDIHVHNEHLRILVLQDINNELDEKEIDSWIRLIRVLTHEIMNSVTPITSLSDTLLGIVGSEDEEIKKGLQTISATGKSLLSFVESYRKFTRIPTPEPTLFYLKPFLERMIHLTRHQHPCTQTTFTVDILPDDLILHADENLIAQVIINLLQNALQATEDNTEGRIIVYAYCNKQEEIIIDISNNGPMIPPEVAEQIFIPFFTTKENGNGIGLSLSRQIMRISGGSLSLIPTPPGQGLTTFRLCFK